MASMVNFLTGKTIPPLFASLTYDNTIEVTKEDPVYYYLRTESDIVRAGRPPFSQKENPLLDQVAAPVQITDGAIVSNEKLKGNGVKTELAFLQELGLAFPKGDAWIVLPHAKQFYAPGIGLFRRDKDGISTDDVKPMYTLFLTYILPGRYWTAYKARDGLALPPSIAYSTKMDQDMYQTVQDYNDLLLKNPNVE